MTSHDKIHQHSSGVISAPEKLSRFREGGAHSSNALGRVRGDGVGAMAEYWTVTQELLQGSDPMVRKPKASARPRPTADLDPSLVAFSKMRDRR